MAPLVCLFFACLCFKFTTVKSVVGILRREQSLAQEVAQNQAFDEERDKEGTKTAWKLMGNEVDGDKRLENMFCPAWEIDGPHENKCTCFKCLKLERQEELGIPVIRSQLGPLCQNASVEERSEDAVAPVIPSKKIFFIGFHKTGTTSFTAIFNYLGYRILHGCQWRLGDDPHVLQQYDVFLDGCDHDFVRLLEQYPESHFVYNTRDMGAWLHSQLRQNSKHLKSIDILGQRVGQLGRQAVSAFTKQRFGCEVDVSEAYVKRAIAQRLDYEARLFKHFDEKKKPLLVLDIGQHDMFRKLAAFIGFHHPPQGLCKFLNKIWKNSLNYTAESTDWKDWVESALRAESLRSAAWVTKAPWYQNF